MRLHTDLSPSLRVIFLLGILLTEIPCCGFSQNIVGHQWLWGRLGGGKQKDRWNWVLLLERQQQKILQSRMFGGLYLVFYSDRVM